MQRFLDDFRYALRQARLSPGFAAIAVGILGLGIGAATAIYSVVDHVLLRPLDLPNSDRVVTVCETHPPDSRYCSVSVANLYDWAASSSTFEALGAARSWSRAMRGERGSAFIAAGIATPGYFKALGVAPARGRLLLEEDQPAPDGGVVVVSHEFWQTELGGGEHVLGRTLVLDGDPFEVVGVLPPGFQAPRLEWIRVWAPFHFAPRSEENRDWRGFQAVGRLRPGVEPQEAEAELLRINAGLAERHPDVLRGWGVTVELARDHIVASVRPVLTVFLAAVVVLLLIVSVNIANLLLARATAREQELSVRLALGAGSAGVTRLLLVEAGTLAAAGTLVGVMVAYAGTSIFVALAPPGIPRMDDVAVDARVLAFAAGVAALSAVIFGLIPAFRARRIDLADAFRDGRSGGPGRGAAAIRRGLVVVQLGLALALVFGAGLLTRSFASLTEWRPGFEVDRLLTFSLSLSPATYETHDDLRALLRRAEAELLAVPEVIAVATVSAGPLFGGGDGQTPLLIGGRPTVPLGEAPTAAWFDAGPGYFTTLGIPLLAGREFGEADDPGASPVAVINRTLAEREWGSANPVGARLRLPDLEEEVEIVGVVADVPPFAPGTQSAAEIYVSNRQRPRWGTFVVLRTRSDPADVAAEAASVLAGVDPDLVPAGIRTMREHVTAQLVRPRFNLALVAGLAAVALLLGAAGIFGVVAYSVALRRREFGIRMALGAAPPAVLRSVLADAGRLLAAGILLGVVASLAFSRLLGSLIVGVGLGDPVAGLATILLLAATVVAAALPAAARAASVEPSIALRGE